MDAILSFAQKATVPGQMTSALINFALSWVSTHSDYDVLAATAFESEWAAKHRPVISTGTKTHWLYAGHNYLEPHGLPVVCPVGHERMYLRRQVHKKHVDIKCVRQGCGATGEFKRFDTDKATVLGRKGLVKVAFEPKNRFQHVKWDQNSENEEQDNAAATGSTIPKPNAAATGSTIPKSITSVTQIGQHKALDARPETVVSATSTAHRTTTFATQEERWAITPSQSPPIPTFQLPPVRGDIIPDIKFELPPIHADLPSGTIAQHQLPATTRRQPPIQLQVDVQPPPPPPDSPSPSPSSTHGSASIPNPTRFTIKLPPRAGKRRTAQPAPALTQRSYSSQEESARPTQSLPVRGQKRRNEESESESSTSQLSQSSKGPKRQDTGHARRQAES